MGNQSIVAEAEKRLISSFIKFDNLTNEEVLRACTKLINFMIKESKFSSRPDENFKDLLEKLTKELKSMSKKEAKVFLRMIERS